MEKAKTRIRSMYRYCQSPRLLSYWVDDIIMTSLNYIILTE